MNNLLKDLIGPQVAIIDNNEDEIKSIEIMLHELNIGSQFFEVDYVEPIYPKQPINTIQLVFLDLFYNDNSLDFEPYACIDWLKAIVPVGIKYILVVWSNDGHRTEELIEVMKATDTPMPYLVETSPKGKYQNGQNEYDIKRLLEDLNNEFIGKYNITSQEFYGQIIEIEKNNVLINCLINVEPAVFEVRRFDIKPFQGLLTPEKGMFLTIKITNKPGSKIFDFSVESNDLSELFKKSDDFEDIEDVSFLNDEIEEDDDNL